MAGWKGQGDDEDEDGDDQTMPLSAGKVESRMRSRANGPDSGQLSPGWVCDDGRSIPNHFLNGLASDPPTLVAVNAFFKLLPTGVVADNEGSACSQQP